MKRLLIFLSFMALVCSDAGAVEWVTDLPSAGARAQKEKKAVLLFFTGSDWCPWCQKLKAEVFETFEFAAYAAANLVMVEVDFPRRKQLSMEKLNANYALAAKYGVNGYPHIVLLNADGQVLGDCSYIEGGPKAFVAVIERFPGMPHKGKYLVSPPADSAANAPGPSRLITMRPPTPGAAAQAPAAPTQYEDLTLKGVSGAGNRRLALINNETFMAGESASVKTFGTNIEVTVKEIRDASVVIIVKGQSRELSLARTPGKP